MHYSMKSTKRPPGTPNKRPSLPSGRSGKGSSLRVEVFPFQLLFLVLLIILGWVGWWFPGVGLGQFFRLVFLLDVFLGGPEEFLISVCLSPGVWPGRGQRSWSSLSRFGSGGVAVASQLNSRFASSPVVLKHVGSISL